MSTSSRLVIESVALQWVTHGWPLTGVPAVQPPFQQPSAPRAWHISCCTHTRSENFCEIMTSLIVPSWLSANKPFAAFSATAGSCHWFCSQLVIAAAAPQDLPPQATLCLNLMHQTYPVKASQTASCRREKRNRARPCPLQPRSSVARCGAHTSPPPSPP
jgi:hypothetical protein